MRVGHRTDTAVPYLKADFPFAAVYLSGKLTVGRFNAAVFQYLEVAVGRYQSLQLYMVGCQLDFAHGISVLVLFLHAHPDKGNLSCIVLRIQTGTFRLYDKPGLFQRITVLVRDAVDLAVARPEVGHLLVVFDHQSVIAWLTAAFNQ